MVHDNGPTIRYATYDSFKSEATIGAQCAIDIAATHQDADDDAAGQADRQLPTPGNHRGAYRLLINRSYFAPIGGIIHTHECTRHCAFAA